MTTKRRYEQSEVTAPEIFFGRRHFLKASGVAIGAAAVGMTGSCFAGGERKPAKKGKGPIQVPFERKDVFPAKRSEAHAGRGVTLTERIEGPRRHPFRLTLLDVTRPGLV